MLVSAAAARRFLVARHLLTPPRALPARTQSVLALVRRLGSLQFDPLELPGARNHELVLHARIRGYRRGWCERWLYGPDRRLFEAYNKSLNILPIEELPYHRVAWTRGEVRYGPLLHEYRREVARMLATIRDRGPLPTTVFSNEHSAMIAGGWGPTRTGRLLVEALFCTGRLGIARRDGNARHYELTERLFPAALLAQRVDDHEAVRHRLLTRVRGVGLLGVAGGAELTTGTGRAPGRKAMLAELVESGSLVQVTVEGLRGERYVLAEEAALLESRAVRRAEVALLAPLDPLLWDRRLLGDLFGFDYTWEIYTPPAKRRHGAYVLPVVYGDRIVGRVEPRLERASATLTILLWRPEPGFVLDRRFRTAFLTALEDYRRFVGAERVEWAAPLSGVG